MTLEDYLAGLRATPPGPITRPTLTICSEGDTDTMTQTPATYTPATQAILDATDAQTQAVVAAIQAQTLVLSQILDRLNAAPVAAPAPVRQAPAQVTGDATPDGIMAAWSQTFGERLGEKAQDILVDASGGNLDLILKGILDVADGIASGKSQKPNKPLAYCAAVIRKLRDGGPRQGGQAPVPAGPIGYPQGMVVIKDTGDDDDAPATVADPDPLPF